MAKGYQNNKKKRVKNLNKRQKNYYRHFDIVQIFKFENDYNRELIEEFDKLTTYLLFYNHDSTF